jgi:hypothetical protein
VRLIRVDSKLEAFQSMPSTTATEPVGRVDPGQAVRLDGFVEQAQAAALALRRLDQQAVDRIVWAMVVAGLELLTCGYEGRPEGQA